MTKLVRLQPFSEEFTQLIISSLKHPPPLVSMAPYFPSTSQAVLILVPVHASLPLSSIQKVGMLEGSVLGPLYLHCLYSL